MLAAEGRRRHRDLMAVLTRALPTLREPREFRLRFGVTYADEAETLMTLRDVPWTLEESEGPFLCRVDGCTQEFETPVPRGQHERHVHRRGWIFPRDFAHGRIPRLPPADPALLQRLLA